MQEISQEIDFSEQNLEQDINQDICNSVISIDDSRGETEGKTVCNLNISPAENTPKSRSRTEKKISYQKLNFDSSQTKITDFYKICEEIKSQILKNATLNKAFSTSANIFCENRQPEMLNNECQKLGPESFFEMLIRAVNKNSSESSSANRYPDELKNLCLYLFLTSGRLAYETLVANIPNGLPSVSTLSRSLSKNYEKCGEGELAFGQLKEFLEKRNYPLRIFISEDQTAIVRRPRYDQSTNQLVGYVLTNLEHTGFPKTNQNLINSVSNIKNIIENSDLAKNAYVFMAQPLQDGAAAFCLTLFGSNNTFTHEDVLLRWKYIQQETTNYNIVVDGISSDGDSRCLKAMKIIAGLPAFSKQETPYSPYFQANFDINNLVPIQDTVHIATKMKNRLLNEKIVLKMGNYEVSKDHLTDLINTVSKDKHLLCLSYLDSK
uniref:Uncharacterized protein n=1 Tax=Photinus pyralis TaxID=7054 RepID=A0A1Y1K6A2_PHOPY